MLDKISDFCKKVNHILIFAILSTILIAILYVISIESSRAEVDIDIKNTPLEPID